MRPVQLYGLFILLYVGYIPLFSQQAEGHVEWVMSFPSEEKEDRTFTQKAIDFIIGKKQVFLIKPVAVHAYNSTHFIAVDQGQGNLLEIQNSKPKVIKATYKGLANFSSLVSVCSMPDGTLLFIDSSLKNIYTLDKRKKKVGLFSPDTLLRPTGIAWNKKTKQLWVLETGAHRVSIMNPKGEIIKTIGQRGSNNKEFNFPTHIWIDEEGIVYIVDAMNFRIKLYSSEGNFIDTFGNQGDASGYFAMPKGVATDSYGHIYVVDALFHTVQIFDRKGRFLYHFGSKGTEKGEFMLPTGIFIDHRDYIYIADSYNARVQVFKLIFKEGTP